jgi:hypothetical protein
MTDEEPTPSDCLPPPPTQRETGGRGENVEIVEVARAIPTNPTISTAPPSPVAVYPEDSILADFMDFARVYSESEDQRLIGSILPVAARASPLAVVAVWRATRSLH